MKYFFTFIICLVLSSCSVFIPGSIVKLGMSGAKDKTIGESIDDTAIEAKIKKELLRQGFKNQYARIDVQVIQGKVMYTGVVQKEEDIISAIEIAWMQKGVKEVINELKLDENSKVFDAKQYAIDSWITSQIKSKLFFTKHVKFVNYTIVTTNNIVYIIGVAQSEEELRKVAKIAAEVKYVEKVISHVRVKSLENL